MLFCIHLVFLLRNKNKHFLLCDVLKYSTCYDVKYVLFLFCNICIFIPYSNSYYHSYNLFYVIGYLQCKFLGKHVFALQILHTETVGFRNFLALRQDNIWFFSYSLSYWCSSDVFILSSFKAAVVSKHMWYFRLRMCYNTFFVRKDLSNLNDIQLTPSKIFIKLTWLFKCDLGINSSLN